MCSSPAFCAPHLQSQITMSSPMDGKNLFFRERFYIFAVSLIFNVQTSFFLRVFYFAKEISDVFGSKRASD